MRLVRYLVNENQQTTWPERPCHLLKKSHIQLWREQVCNMKIESYIKGLCEEQRKIVFDNITTYKTHTLFQFHLPHCRLSRHNSRLYIQNCSMQTWVLAAEESTIACMRASDIEQAF